jgi:hypothetical protein
MGIGHPSAYQIIRKGFRMDVIKKLLTSRRVWLAILAVFTTALSVAFPQVPATMVGAVQTLCELLIVMFTVDDVATAVMKAYLLARGIKS